MKLFLILAITFLIGIASSAQAQTISAGSKSGWTYYGLLKPTEEWVDLNFTPLGNPSGSRRPTRDMHLRCSQIMKLRRGPVVSKPDGTLEWPPIIGLLFVGTAVKVTEVAEYPSNQGLHYWVKVSGE